MVLPWFKATLLLVLNNTIINTKFWVTNIMDRWWKGYGFLGNSFITMSLDQFLPTFFPLRNPLKSPLLLVFPPPLLLFGTLKKCPICHYQCYWPSSCLLMILLVSFYWVGIYYLTDKCIGSGGLRGHVTALEFLVCMLYLYFCKTSCSFNIWREGWRGGWSRRQ